MAHSIDPAADEFIARPHPYLRSIALLLLLIGEALLFSMRFEAPTHFSQELWGSWLVHRSHLIFRLILVIPIAFAVFGGLPLLVRLRRAIVIQALVDDHWPSRLVAHGLALAGFIWLTLMVREGNLTTSTYSGGWALAWVASGLAVCATWMATFLSSTTWITLLWRSRRAAVMSLSVAITAFLLANSMNDLADSMAKATLVIVRSMLSLVSRNVTCDPAVMDLSLDGFKVNIGTACSGLEVIELAVSFFSAYLWWFRRSMRWPQSFLLLPVGAGVIFLLNSVRIATLVLIETSASPDLTFGAFHTQTGWLSFLGVGFVVAGATRRSTFFDADQSGSEPAIGSSPAAAFLIPFGVVLATSMMTGIFASGFDRLYGFRVLAGGLALWYFRRELAGLLSGWSWVGVATGVVAFGIRMALEPASTGGGLALASAVGEMPKGQAWAWIALQVIGSVAIIPLVEELTFRGYLMRRLRSVDFQSIPIGNLFWPTLLVSSAVFGLLHGRWLAGMLVGVLYGLALCRRGKLGDAIVAHAVTNALIAATVLSTGDWTMWT